MLKSLLVKAACILAVATVFVACSGSDDTTGDITARFRTSADENASPRGIARLDSMIASYIGLDSTGRAEMIVSQRHRLDGLGYVFGDTVSNQSMLLWSTWPATTMFMPEVEKIYTDLDPEEKALGRILAIAGHNGLDIPANDFVAVTWGNQLSMGLVDSVMYIALNHYLGPLNQAYNSFPEYQKRLKTRDMIPVDMAEALVGIAYPYRPEGDNTVLSRLIYEGSLAVAKQTLVPGAPLYAVLGFTPEAMEDVRTNENVMWQRLITDNKLYSTDAELHHDLFALKGHTATISNDAPGRAVRYIGYRIVVEYLKSHPEATLLDILSSAFYSNGQATLRASGYAG